MKINWFKLSTDIIQNTLFIIITNDSFNRHWKITTFLNHLQIGIKCKDCEELYFRCECNNNENLSSIPTIINFCKYNLSFDRIANLNKAINIYLTALEFKKFSKENERKIKNIKKIMKDIYEN